LIEIEHLRHAPLELPAFGLVTDRREVEEKGLEVEAGAEEETVDGIVKGDAW